MGACTSMTGMDIRDQYAYLKPQYHVWVFILLSTAIHAGLVTLLILGGLFAEHRSGFRERARITALLRKGVPKPESFLPDKLPAPAAAPPKEVRPPRSGKSAQVGPASSRANYTKEMKEALAKLTQEGGRKPQSEELEGFPEGVEDGEALIAQKGNEYMTKIHKAVKAQYAVPEIISERERRLLNATVVITLDKQGRLKQLSFEKRSGNPIFDSAIEGAIRRAAPFPQPPPELAERYATEGIGLDFDARGM